MAYVTLDESVFTDARFDVLACALGVHRDSAVLRMVRVWAQCRDRGTDRLAVRFLAPMLGCGENRVVAALCEAADLGEVLGGDDDALIRIRGCSDRVLWPGKAVERAKTRTT